MLRQDLRLAALTMDSTAKRPALRIKPGTSLGRKLL
jgi:hypothetical protein